MSELCSKYINQKKIILSKSLIKCDNLLAYKD